MVRTVVKVADCYINTMIGGTALYMDSPNDGMLLQKLQGTIAVLSKVPHRLRRMPTLYLEKQQIKS